MIVDRCRPPFLRSAGRSPSVNRLPYRIARVPTGRGRWGPNRGESPWMVVRVVASRPTQEFGHAPRPTITDVETVEDVPDS